MESREELRQFIAENWDLLDETTVSANMAIGYPNVPGGKDTDEETPDDVHQIDIEDTDDTDDSERGSQTAHIKMGGSKNEDAYDEGILSKIGKVTKKVAKKSGLQKAVKSIRGTVKPAVPAAGKAKPRKITSFAAAAKAKGSPIKGIVKPGVPA